MLSGFGKNLRRLASKNRCSTNVVGQVGANSQNVEAIVKRLLTKTLSHRFTTLKEEGSNTELMNEFEFLLQKFEGSNTSNQNQELLRQENYEILFPEDSKEIPFNDVRYKSSLSNKNVEYVSVEEHLEDLLTYMKEDLELHSLNTQNNNLNSTQSSTDEDSQQQQQKFIFTKQKDNNANPISKELYYTPRYFGKTAEVKKVLFFNTNVKTLSKNCTPKIINMLISASDLYNTLPTELVERYRRKMVQFLSLIFYKEIQVSIPLPQLRKILFFCACHSLFIHPPLAAKYFAHHKLSNIFEVPTQDFYPLETYKRTNSNLNEGNEHQNEEVSSQEQQDSPSHILHKLSKSNENELKFDNLIDLINFIFIFREKHMRVFSPYIQENALQNIEGLIEAIKKKQYQFKFKSFLMLYSQLVQLYNVESQTSQPAEIQRLKKIVEDVSQIMFQIIHQVQFAEQKVEILLLFTLAGEKEKVDFYLPVVKNHIKQHIDNLNISEEVLKVICYSISSLKSNHEDSYNYFMDILYEQSHLSNRCLQFITQYQNDYSEDVPFKIKRKLLQLSDQDSLNAIPNNLFFTNPKSKQDESFVHPTLRFQFGFQQKLMVFNKSFNFLSIDDKQFLRLMNDIEGYNHQVITEDFTFSGVASLFLALGKLRKHDSPLFANLEEYLLNLLENHAFEKREVIAAVTILLSYAQSTHILSQKFIETSMVFLCYNLGRCDAAKHHIVYRYLTTLMVKLHNKEYGPHLTFSNCLRPHFGLIMHELNKVNVLEEMRNMKIPLFLLQQFYYTLSIISPEQYEKIKIAKHIHEEVNTQTEAKRGHTTETAFTQEIQSILDGLNIQYEKEKKILFYTCDFYLPKYNLVLEANGPTHYILNTDTLTAQHSIKKLHLEQAGYKMQDINYTVLFLAEVSSKEKALNEIKINLISFLNSLKQNTE